MKKAKNILSIVILLVIFGYAGYKILIGRFITNYLLKTDAVYTKAVIIDDKNYMGNRSSIYAYSYMFTISGKIYTNNSHDSNLKIGDSVEVEYVKNWPSLNKPLHPKE